MNIVAVAIGSMAAVLTTFSFLPQFIRLLKTKEIRGLSTHMLFQMATGLFLWTIYGILKKDIVIILANLVGFAIMLSTIIIYFMIKKYKR
ncbi:MAG: SemiSWEET transporter [Campylobacterota bacterium]|nr:SemiSWEET transporter [Campylobacterota bacterium]